MSDKLKFGFGNAKLSISIATFSLPAGHTCPFAKECMTKTDRITGKIIDGKHCRFRCFAASQECTFPSIRKSRWKNYDTLLSAGNMESMAHLIQRSIPEKTNIMRVHVSGDFFSEAYFLAWLNVAWNNPLTTFYGYTKATPFLVKYKKHIPNNFRFTASKGGTCDSLIQQHHLRYAEVVFSTDEAKEKGLEIDHDDSHCFGGYKSFALLIHGTQPPNSEASKAWMALRKQGIGGYGRSNISRNKTIQIRPNLQFFVSLDNGKIKLHRESIYA